jgi:hypothetical protein|tara:strand:- start:1988 stop:2194 length:207 start_codon:yes stop_codon:yes gene_type:complete
MNKKETIKLSILIVLLCYSFFRLGQGNPEVITKEVIKEVEVNDKGFCVACYKKHNYDEMYLLMNDYTD